MTLQRELEEHSKTSEFMEESLKLAIAEMLAIEQDNRNLTRAEFAVEADISPGDIYKILNTKRNLTLKSIAKYCASLGVRPNLTFIKIETGKEVRLFSNKFDEYITS